MSWSNAANEDNRLRRDTRGVRIPTFSKVAKK
jgi:hypothetical protein